MNFEDFHSNHFGLGGQLDQWWGHSPEMVLVMVCVFFFFSGGGGGGGIPTIISEVREEFVLLIEAS